MNKMTTKMKIVNIILLVLIVIGTYLLFTQDKWVTPLTNYILSFENNEDLKTGSRWTGKINAVKTDCIFDGICSVTVSDVEVVVVQGMVALEEGAEVGKLIGAESVSDVSKYIGKEANVFARKIGNNVYSLYGNSEFFIEIKN